MHRSDRVMAAYGKVAGPLFAEILTRHSCIAASRITAECLAGFGFKVNVRPTKLIVTARSLKLAYCAGLSEAERSTAASSEHVPTECADPWNGHAVVIARSRTSGKRYLVDGSFAQAAMPERGVNIPPGVLILPIADDAIADERMHLTAKLELDDGLILRVDYVPTDDMSFKTSEAWLDEDAPMVAAMIAAAMEARLG